MKTNIESRSISPQVIRENDAKELNQYIVQQEYRQSPSVPIIKRFAININNTKYLIGQTAANPKQKSLNNIEEEAFKIALKELSIPNTHVVLVDVFVREEIRVQASTSKNKNDVEYRIKKDSKTNSSEIHTICLWKKAADTIEIIDPTDSKFTDYLENCLKSLSPNWSYKPQRHHLSYQEKSIEDRFYFRGITPEGKKEGDSRDCIDIAVKIAFSICNGLEENLSTIEIQQSIKKLSNLQSVNKTIGLEKEGFKASTDGTLLRELQKSDLLIRQDTLTKLENNKLGTQYLSIDTIKELNLLSNGSFDEKITKK